MFNLFYGGATNALPIFIMPTTSVFPYSKYEVEIYDKTDIISEINQSDIDKDLLIDGNKNIYEFFNRSQIQRNIRIRFFHFHIFVNFFKIISK